MTWEKFKRIIWRLEDLKKDFFLKSELEEEIMKEAGTDPRTLERYITQLKKLGFIKCKSKRWSITSKKP